MPSGVQRTHRGGRIRDLRQWHPVRAEVPSVGVQGDEVIWPYEAVDHGAIAAVFNIADRQLLPSSRPIFTCQDERGGIKMEES